MFTRKMMLRAGFVAVFGLGVNASALAAVIESYFGMNFLGSNYYGGEVQLVDITYWGGSGIVTQAIPAFPGRLGMPDAAYGSDSVAYTSGGDGESTRTLGVTMPIDWSIGLFYAPLIRITDITVNVLGGGGIWTAHSDYGYEVGMIPLGAGTELASFLSAPLGDIYGGTYFPGSGNPAGTFISTSTPPGLEYLLGQAFGDFRFAAAQASPVPVPAAIWLFGSGLFGLAGIARRKAGRGMRV